MSCCSDCARGKKSCGSRSALGAGNIAALQAGARVADVPNEQLYRVPRSAPMSRTVLYIGAGVLVLGGVLLALRSGR